MTIEIIHVYLPLEAVDCWYPRRAEHLDGDRYRIVDENPVDPICQFGKGDVVRCRPQKLTDGAKTHEGFVAFEISN
jgi:hypothetical protein